MWGEHEVDLDQSRVLLVGFTGYTPRGNVHTFSAKFSDASTSALATLVVESCLVHSVMVWIGLATRSALVP